jgi:SAM-dependent methyltransferase
LRKVVTGIIKALDVRLIEIEKARGITGSETISSSYHTVQDNRTLWDTCDWSDGGDQWTNDVRLYRNLDPEQWKGTLIQKFINDAIPPDSVLLEIGPGAGRWTEHLEHHASRLILADISATCLDICRRRFGSDERFEFHLIVDGTLSFIPNDSIDVIWSYDVFVHINPADTENYMREFARILRPGGLVIIHHSGTYSDPRIAATGFRSHMTAAMFAKFARENRLKVVRQETETAHIPGDVITTLTKARVQAPGLS